MLPAPIAGLGGEVPEALGGVPPRVCGFKVYAASYIGLGFKV